MSDETKIDFPECNYLGCVAAIGAPHIHRNELSDNTRFVVVRRRPKPQKPRDEALQLLESIRANTSYSGALEEKFTRLCFLISLLTD